MPAREQETADPQGFRARGGRRRGTLRAAEGRGPRRAGSRSRRLQPRPDPDAPAQRRRALLARHDDAADRAPTRREGRGAPSGQEGLRKLMRWYVEPSPPSSARSTTRRSSSSTSCSRRSTRSRAARRRAEALPRERGGERRLARELEERLTRVERRGAAPRRPPSPPSRPRARPGLLRLREPHARPHRRRSASASAPTSTTSATRRPVLDLGCGRGEFLALPARGGHRGARRRRRRRHGRVRARRGPRRRAGRRARAPRAARGRLARRRLRRAGRRAPAPGGARAAARARRTRSSGRAAFSSPRRSTRSRRSRSATTSPT